MRFRHPCKHRGFTLIELMIVVTILALLPALLIPALGKAQTRAIEQDCASKIKNIPIMFKQYSMKYDGWTSDNPKIFIRIFFRRRNRRFEAAAQEYQ